jgi:hypothetical protein
LWKGDPKKQTIQSASGRGVVRHDGNGADTDLAQRLGLRHDAVNQPLPNPLTLATRVRDSLGFIHRVGAITANFRHQNHDHRVPTPLLFKQSLRFAVTVNESGVAQIVASVIHGGA